MGKTAQEIIAQEIEAIKSIPLSGIDDAVNCILNCKGKVIFTGMGKAGLIARKIAATMSSTGTPALFMHPSEAQHGDLGILGEGDMIIALSNSGKTREVIETVSLAKVLIPSIKLVTITSSKYTELALLAEFTLETGGYPEICPFGMAPTSSTTAMLVIGDILSIMVMESKEFSIEEYSRRHHGGYLGKKSRGEV